MHAFPAATPLFYPLATASSVALAKLAVPIPVRVLLQVFEVKELQRHAGPSALGVQIPEVGQRPIASLPLAARPVQPPLKIRVGQPLGFFVAFDRGDLRLAYVSRHPPKLTPRLRATSRWLRPRTHFCRRIPRVLCMDSLSVAIPPSSCCEEADGGAAVQRRDRSRGCPSAC